MMRLSLFLFLLALMGCTSPNTEPEASPAGSSTTVVPVEISVTVIFPKDSAPLLGPASGRVRDIEGELVAEFEFESAWDLPPGWNYQDELSKTGAATSLELELPGPGSYQFELDEYVTSDSSCGTCEAGIAAVSVSLDITDGFIIRMPKGERAWQS